jgi:hypothetical protein
MEFLRWVVLQWEKDFIMTGAFIPCLALNALIIFVSFLISGILGIILIILSLTFWSFVGYVYISREVKEFYIRYEKERGQNDKKA